MHEWRVRDYVMTDLRIAVTGHRPKTLGGYSPDNPMIHHIKRALSAHLLSLQPSLVYTGMALGVDQWMAEVCVEMGIPYVAAVPFSNQASRWPRESWMRWNYLLHLAQSVEILFDSPTSDREAATLLNRRNEWMVDRTDIVLAVWNGSAGGTANCRRYALKKGVRVIDINPAGLFAQPQNR